MEVISSVHKIPFKAETKPTEKEQAKRTYSPQRGEGWMAVIRNWSPLLHPNRETINVLLELNKGVLAKHGVNMPDENSSSLPPLKLGMNVQLPEVPEVIGRSGVKVIAVKSLKGIDTYHNIALEYTGNEENASVIRQLNNNESINDLQFLYVPLVTNRQWGDRIELQKNSENVKNGVKGFYVQAGEDDSIYSLAEEHTGTVLNSSQIRKLNDTEGISRGDHLFIPYIPDKVYGLKFHVVEPGENLFRVVKDYVDNNPNLKMGTKKYLEQVKSLNKIKDVKNISPGNLIFFPGSNPEITQRLARTKQFIALEAVRKQLNKEAEAKKNRAELNSLRKRLHIEYRKKNKPGVIRPENKKKKPPESTKSTQTSQTPPVVEILSDSLKRKTKDRLKSQKPSRIAPSSTKTKRKKVTRPPTFTRGVTTNHKLWKRMEKLVHAYYPGIDFDVNKLADIFDLAHLSIKEIDLRGANPKEKQLEMQLISLTVMNRLKTVKTHRNYRRMWGRPDIEKVILHPYQYSSFNSTRSLNISSMDRHLLPDHSNWEQAVIAAVKVYTGHLSEIPKSLRGVVSYYNPDLCSPRWEGEKLNGVRRFIALTRPGKEFDHIFCKQNPRIKGAIKG